MIKIMASQVKSGKPHLFKSILAVQLIFAILLCIGGCTKHAEDQELPTIHTYPGIVVINTIGQQMGTWGADDGDWRTDNIWSEEEFALLDFPDTIGLNGTFLKDTIGWNNGTGIHEQPQNIVIVYPNPTNNYQFLVYRGLGLLKLKVTIVDKFHNRMFTYACKDSTSDVQLNFSDSTKFKNGTVYRMYYSLSATGNLNFHKGHGDILICREGELQDCHKFVP